jgi:hypothetical protein
MSIKERGGISQVNPAVEKLGTAALHSQVVDRKLVIDLLDLKKLCSDRALKLLIIP